MAGLAINRKVGESIIIYNPEQTPLFRITLVEGRPWKAILKIEAPQDWKILREELATESKQ